MSSFSKWVEKPENRKKHQQTNLQSYHKNKTPICRAMVADMSFRTLNDLKEYTRSLITKNLDVVIDSKHENWNFFLDLFRRHPDYCESTPPVAFKFFTKDAPEQMFRGEPYRPHYRETENGVFHKFSITKCLTQKATSASAQRIKDMRTIITPQIKKYRLSNPKCVGCGCSDFSLLDIDHVIPFKQLCSDYNAEHADGTLDAWYGFHEKNATLQTLCIPCHKKKTFEGSSSGSE